MLSVENFPWIIWQNLAQPFGLGVHYYYPFGTKDNLSLWEFSPVEPRQDHHVLLHFDQEPIWNDDFGRYDHLQAAWAQKIVRILANSEHSAMKKQLCRQRNMLDWYFFYHGLAALDWFRDSQYIDREIQPRKVFCSYTHQIRDNRAYRIGLTARIANRDLIQFGDISFHGSRAACEAELADPCSRLTEQDKKHIRSGKFSQLELPLILDKGFVNGAFSAHFGHAEYLLWQNSFVHLVNETVFYQEKLHLTEKIFKPIVSMRPFLLAAAPGNLAYLRRYGFQTFDRWWDERYDSVTDSDTRLDMIVDILIDLCRRPKSDLHRMHEEMKPSLEFNKRHFFGNFRKQVIEELVDNFEHCTRIWNNGRIDGRERHADIDLDAVKKRLLA